MTFLSLLAFLLPAVILVSVVTAAVARLSLRVAVASGLIAALGVAEIVNLVSGTAHGPAARSTFLAAAFTVLAVTAVLGPAPALFAAAVVGVVVGALGLGAGSEVAPVAVATAVVVVVALALVEAQDRRWARRPPQLVAVVALALVVGGLVAVIALQADRRLDGEPAVLAPGAVQPSIRPPVGLGDPDSGPPPSANPTSTVDPDAPPPSSESTSTLRTIWLVVLVVTLVVLLGVVLRISWVALAWRLLRRRLRQGTEREQVAGAWVWSTRRLRAAGWSMPLSLSADAVSAGQGTSDLPRVLRSSLREVAGATVHSVYAPRDEDHEPDIVWAAADEVGRGAVTALRPARRLVFALRPISSVPSHTTAHAPAAPEENRS